MRTCENLPQVERALSFRQTREIRVRNVLNLGSLAVKLLKAAELNAHKHMVAETYIIDL